MLKFKFIKDRITLGKGVYKNLPGGREQQDQRKGPPAK